MQASAFLKCWISTWTLSRSYKEYIDGPTIAELIHDSISVAGYLPQVRDMAAKAQNCGLNIDYYPTNFVVSGGLLWYIDYMNYGYLWYKPFDDREVYAAIGDSGNIIYVNKDMNVSVGMTGTFKPRIFDRVDFIEHKLLPVIDG